MGNYYLDMKKKIFVTGGTGFIGSNICKYLVNIGHKVTILDNNSRGKNRRIKDISKKIKFIKGDIRDRKVIFKSLKNIDLVIHLAYVNGTKYFYSKPTEILDIAVKGLINIFDASIKYKIPEMILASSSEVYQTPLKVPTEEDEPLKIPNIFNPRYTYGGGKILTELYGANFGKKYFKRLIIFRPHNVYGKDMGNEHVIPELIQKISKIKKKNGKIKIYGTGNEIRSFIHIDDFIKAFDCIFRKGSHLSIYNIGTQKKIKIRDLVKLIIRKMGKNLKITKSSKMKGGTNIRCPNISKINKLGFKDRISLDVGIQKILKEKNLLFSKD